MLSSVSSSWSNYDSVIAKRVYVDNPKFMKFVKKGFRNFLKDPTILFNKKKQTIKLHFDMFHGYGKLDQAIDVMHEKDKNEFRDFVNKSTSYNPHIMFIAKPEILNNWFAELFAWLSNCEEIFGFENLSGYGLTRIYGFLAERFMSYWFQKYTKYKTMPIIFYDITNDLN